jgi:hypothetical protein
MRQLICTSPSGRNSSWRATIQRAPVMAVKDQAEKGATVEDSAALSERRLIAAANSLPIRRYRWVS